MDRDHLISLLKRHWGYDTFRPLQEEIIRSVLNKKDTIALLPTGGGKSVCYQLPALTGQGFTLVISPLIALMQDQTERLKAMGISAAYLHAGLHHKAARDILDSAQNRAYRLLYISPERLQTGLFLEYLPSLNVDLLAVDEAHCISQWGHDFRPDYLKISRVRTEHPHIPVLALTASATPDVVEDIEKQLQLRSAEVFKQSFRRNNIFYEVSYPENKPAECMQRINAAETGIIYCRSRKQTELLCSLLRQNDIAAVAYHAGMDRETRAQAQAAWMNDECRLMTATTAFGMGIDKPDVRLVLHYDAPEHLEAWYQETGRAGRDGNMAAAVTLYSQADISRLEKSTQVQFPPEDYLRKVYQCVCEYLQVPVGASPDRYFDFDLVELCKRFRLEALPAAHALKLLEQQGLWTISDAVYHPSTVQFLADRNELDVLYRSYPDIAYFCTGLLRLYGNIFHYPAPIREGNLARQLKTGRKEATAMLHRLASMNIADYQPAKAGPQLYFHHLRVAEHHLLLDLARINRLRRKHEERTQAMIRFLTNETICRNRMLLAYFGEPTGRDCGNCDICTRKQAGHGGTAELIRQKLLAAGRQEITIAELLAAFPNAEKDEVYGVIRRLADEGIITLNGQGNGISRKSRRQ